MVHQSYIFCGAISKKHAGKLFLYGLYIFSSLLLFKNSKGQTATVANGAVVTVSASTTVTTPGNINIATGGSIKNNGSLQLQGNWTNNGSYSDVSGTVTFNATATGKTISGLLTGTDKFNNLVFNGIGGAWTFTDDAEVGANLSLANGMLTAPPGILTLDGSIMQTSGGFLHNNGSVLLGGSLAQSYTAATPLTFYNLINNNRFGLPGFSVNNDLIIENELQLMSLSKLNLVSGDIILRSTASNTANVAPVPAETNIITYGTGRFIVERFIATGTGPAPDHGKSWQLLATPATGQTIRQAWKEGAVTANGNPNPGFGTMLSSDLPNAVTQPNPGFDAVSPRPSMKIYNSLTNDYDGVISTQAPIYNQKGYFVFVRGDRSVTALNQAATPTVLRTKGTLFTPLNPPPVTTVLADKFESIGNPYASTLDVRNILKTGGADEFFYVWDPRLGGSRGLGAFQTLSKSGANYIVTPGGGSFGVAGSVHNFIQSGQAFLVQATANNGTVSFVEGSKANSDVLVNLTGQATDIQRLLQTSLYSISNDGSSVVVDGVLSSFGDSFSNEVDGFDARKAINTDENLSIKTKGKLLVIERKQPIAQKDTIFLNLAGVKLQPYRFRFHAENLSTGLEGFLEDNYLHSRTPLNLNGNTTMDFNISNVPGSYAPGRFRIVFAPSIVLPVTLTSVKAYRQDQNIVVEWKVDNEKNIKQYEVEKSVNGTQFIKVAVKPATANNGNSAVYLSTDTRPVNGYNYYRVKSIDINGGLTYTNVVKVLMSSVKQEITIYPNPVKDRVIHLQFTNQPEGKYNIRLLDKLGQVIVSGQIIHAEGSSTELIKCGYNLAHGMYQLEVTRPDGSGKDINVVY